MKLTRALTRSSSANLLTSIRDTLQVEHDTEILAAIDSLKKQIEISQRAREVEAKVAAERLAEARRRTIRDIHGAFDLNFDPIAVLSYSIDPEINYIGDQWPPAMVASTRVKIVVLADAVSITSLKQPESIAKSALKIIARIAEENSK